VRPGVLLNLTDRRPCTDVCTKRLVKYFYHSKRAQPCKRAPPLFYVSQDGGRDKHADFFAALEVVKETSGIVIKEARAVFAGFNACGASNALVEIYLRDDTSFDLPDDVSFVNRADPDAVVAAYAFIQIVFYNIVHEQCSSQLIQNTRCVNTAMSI